MPKRLCAGPTPSLMQESLRAKLPMKWNVHMLKPSGTLPLSVTLAGIGISTILFSSGVITHIVGLDVAAFSASCSEINIDAMSGCGLSEVDGGFIC